MNIDFRKQIFIAVETQDESKLISLLEKIKSKEQESFWFYWMDMWWDFFDREKDKDFLEKLQVPICGSMDFSPLQHALYLGWFFGAKLILDYKLNYIYDMGMGLPSYKINVEELNKYCENL